jgi:uncharacterized protein (DUF983 family)
MLARRVLAIGRTSCYANGVADQKDVLRDSVSTLLKRALQMRCPRCGKGPIFRRWYTYSEHPACPVCGLAYDARGESLGFMYLSTAFITGLFFLVLILMPPQNLQLYRIALAASALVLYAATMPLRKSIAIALNYFHTR